MINKKIKCCVAVIMSCLVKLAVANPVINNIILLGDNMHYVGDVSDNLPHVWADYLSLPAAKKTYHLFTDANVDFLNDNLILTTSAPFTFHYEILLSDGSKPTEGQFLIRAGENNSLLYSVITPKGIMKIDQKIEESELSQKTQHHYNWGKFLTHPRNEWSYYESVQEGIANMSKPFLDEVLAIAEKRDDVFVSEPSLSLTLSDQVKNYLQTTAMNGGYSSNQTAFFIWSGTTDLLHFITVMQNAKGKNREAITATQDEKIGIIVDDIIKNIHSLVDAGVTPEQIYVFGLRYLDNFPFLINLSPALSKSDRENLHNISNKFNTALQKKLGQASIPAAHFIDMNSLAEQVKNHFGTYGINVDYQACNSTSATSCDHYFFYNNIHFTTAMGKIIAQKVDVLLK